MKKNGRVEIYFIRGLSQVYEKDILIELTWFICFVNWLRNLVRIYFYSDNLMINKLTNSLYFIMKIKRLIIDWVINYFKNFYRRKINKRSIKITYILPLTLLEVSWRNSISHRNEFRTLKWNSPKRSSSLECG